MANRKVATAEQKTAEQPDTNKEQAGAPVGDTGGSDEGSSYQPDWETDPERPGYAAGLLLATPATGEPFYITFRRYTKNTFECVIATDAGDKTGAGTTANQAISRVLKAVEMPFAGEGAVQVEGLDTLPALDGEVRGDANDGDNFKKGDDKPWLLPGEAEYLETFRKAITDSLDAAHTAGLETRKQHVSIGRRMLDLVEHWRGEPANLTERQARLSLSTWLDIECKEPGSPFFADMRWSKGKGGANFVARSLKMAEVPDNVLAVVTANVKTPGGFETRYREIMRGMVRPAAEKVFLRHLTARKAAVDAGETPAALADTFPAHDLLAATREYVEGMRTGIAEAEAAAAAMVAQMQALGHKAQAEAYYSETKQIDREVIAFFDWQNASVPATDAEDFSEAFAKTDIGRNLQAAWTYEAKAVRDAAGAKVDKASSTTTTTKATTAETSRSIQDMSQKEIVTQILNTLSPRVDIAEILEMLITVYTEGGQDEERQEETSEEKSEEQENEAERG